MPRTVSVGISPQISTMRLLFCLVTRRPTRATHPVTLCPRTTLFRSAASAPSRSRPPLDKKRGDPKAALTSCRRWRERLEIAVILFVTDKAQLGHARALDRSEEHTSELQSLMRISYAVFCLKKKKQKKTKHTQQTSELINYTILYTRITDTKQR